jgi:UDP-galactopyranose mutase
MDMVCFSQIPWGSRHERPQELMGRAAKDRRVFYIEPPSYAPKSPQLLTKNMAGGLWKVTPVLPEGLSLLKRQGIQATMIRQLLEVHAVHDFTLLTYDPTVVGFARFLKPRLMIYDCLTRYSPGDGYPFTCESELLHQADMVVCDAQTIVTEGRVSPDRERVFPGSLDIGRFLDARANRQKPPELASIPHPRLGFWGVINYLFDWRLVEAVAELRPDWHILLLGPITVDPGSLLSRQNVHYLCTRTQFELPAYPASWDVTILPIHRDWEGMALANAQIPQSLAAGCPVVSTSSLAARRFAVRGLVECAETIEEFIRAVERALAGKKNNLEWLASVGNQLADSAWDMAWDGLRQLIELGIQRLMESAPGSSFQESILKPLETVAR